MFKKVLIANRGEIACRVIRTLDRMGIASVAVYSEADRHARHVALAGEAIHIGPAPARESYLDAEKILAAAKATGAEAIHPGYGFLSENADFAEACEAAGIVFIGPTPAQMRDFGLKHTARELAEKNEVPLLPGTKLLTDPETAEREAARIGYPVIIKSTAGGGGIGMQVCRHPTQLAASFESVQRLSRSNFKEGGLYLEKYIESARHIEVQLFGDGRGNVIALGERDCSAQRRNQKVIEETPAPHLAEATRSRLCDAAVRLGRSVGYRSAGTVEFVFDAAGGGFYFLEVNTRLQVEHGVTEEVTGLDLVEWMVRTAAGDPPDLAAYEKIHLPQGHAIQVRIYAEDPGKNFQPSSGILTEVAFPDGIRCDSWIETGSEVSPYYDPLVAKLIVHGSNRPDALAKLAAALDASRLAGIETNLDYLGALVRDAVFEQGRMTTRYLTDFSPPRRTVDVLAPGTMTTVQDYPGRTGYWAVGVPPSGPMDSLAFRLGNRLLRNKIGAAGLEMTASGPTLQFHASTMICLTGATMTATLDDAPIPYWAPVAVSAGSTLKLGPIVGPGLRTYLCVRGGWDAPDYLGSKATFTLGQFGGHGGRMLRVGDVLKLRRDRPYYGSSTALPSDLIPAYGNHWDIAVLYGPHGAPDFFTPEDIQTFFSTDWAVHYNSARTGVRLIGPKPVWARQDGGEAGLHPSNIHDNAYAIGTIDFTGDMPVMLGPDGPSLGGFVCPATIIQAELWKIGQLKPGDTIRFRCVSFDDALAWERRQDEAIATLAPSIGRAVTIPPPRRASLAEQPAGDERPAICYRPAGDKYLLVEYGPVVLDLELRFRVHALMTWLEKRALPSILDLTPGIRSLQIHYDSRALHQAELLAILRDAEVQLPANDDLEVPTRTVWMPLSWEDPATLLTIQKYMQSVRRDAPWCPSNIEFIRRINGLDSIDEVRRIIFDACYLVMGLGDVYLGAPVATPLDPRHRLVTTKYNPARTWTPDNVVGIGGAYMCVYGMEGPGGYQLFGRTCQVWNRYRTTPEFSPGKPWLLRFFDQIRFYPVTGEELLRFREDFPQGKARLRIEEGTFRLPDYRAYLTSIQSDSRAFQERQQAAFHAERERWAAMKADESAPAVIEAAGVSETEFPSGTEYVAAGITASVWKVLVQPGERVEKNQPLVVLESMKMEIFLDSPHAGEVLACFCAEGQMVQADQNLVAIKPGSSEGKIVP
jgi:urea carboxylase